MESIATWPLLQRNKVEDSQIDTTVGVLAESENEVVAGLAKKVNHHSTPIDLFVNHICSSYSNIGQRSSLGIEYQSG